jgi:hypothetical protein
MDLRHLGAVGERLAVAGNAGPVGVDHHGIGEDHSDHVFGLTDGDSLPAFVASELRESDLGSLRSYSKMEVNLLQLGALRASKKTITSN